MSLREYLLTRMALRQDARQRELDIEQARASRQAAEQAAYFQYGNAALQAAVQGAGKFAGAMSEADAAQKALEAEAIQASAASRALEGANAAAVGGMPVEGGETVATPEEAYKIAPYKSPVYGLLPDKLTAPSIPTSPPAVIAPAVATKALMSAEPAPATRTPEQAKAAEDALVAKLQADENMTPGARAAADIFGTPAGTVEMPAGTNYAPTPSDSTSVTRSGTSTARDTTLVPQADFVYKAPSTPVSSAQTPAPPSEAQSVKVPEIPMGSRITQGLLNQRLANEREEATAAGARAIIEKTVASPPAVVPAQIAVPAATPPVAAARTGAEAALQATTTPLFAPPPAVPGEGKVPTPPPSEKMPEGAGGAEKTLPSAPPAAAVLANPDPAQDKVWTKEVLDNSVKQIADLKLRTGLDLNKPAVAKSIEQASKVTGYTPPVYTKTARELAKEVTDQVWKTRPPGNPLTALFMRDNSALNKQIAEDKAFLIISGARTKHSAEHLDNFVKLEEMRTKQSLDKRKMDLMESQALLNDAKSNKVSTDLNIKKPLDTKGRELLNSADNANRDLKRVVTTGKKLLAKGGSGLPIGALRAVAAAGITALGADVTSPTSTSLGGGGVLAGVSGATTGGGKFIDDKKFNEAMTAVDLASLDPDQRQFIGNLKLAIQTAGKQREGGKLTDADLRFYLDNLVAMDNPEVALRQINNLIEDTNTQYTRNFKSLSESVTSGMAGYKSELEAEYFDDTDISNARESAPRAMQTFAATRAPRPTSDALRAGISAAAAALKKALSSGNVPAATAAAAELKRLQAEAAAAAAAASSSSGNPDL